MANKDEQISQLVAAVAQLQSQVQILQKKVMTNTGTPNTRNMNYATSTGALILPPITPKTKVVLRNTKKSTRQAN